MKAIRAAFSLFFLAILVFAALGWHWAGTLPVDKMMGARSVLALIAASSIGGIFMIWKANPVKTC